MKCAPSGSCGGAGGAGGLCAGRKREDGAGSKPAGTPAAEDPDAGGHGQDVCREGVTSCDSLLRFGYSDSYLFRMKCLLKAV